MLRVALVACEDSGDDLGAALIKDLRKILPKVEFCGVGGRQMVANGLNPLFPIEGFGIMGFGEVLIKYRQLKNKRQQLIDYFIREQVDVMIGIDAPEFNLYIENQLKQSGIKTVHYVSPTVWAWRRGRVHTVARSCDLLLCLYPFEKDFYPPSELKIKFVGHPLADAISAHNDKQAARKNLKIKVTKDQKIIALLPGSRKKEIKMLGSLFIDTAIKCWEQDPSLRFVICASNAERKQEIIRLLAAKKAAIKDGLFSVFEGNGQQVMASADVVLLSSGTATLECSLVNRPMVVVYRVPWFDYLIYLLLIRVPHIAQPNWLAGKRIVPEFMQMGITPQRLAQELFSQLKQMPNKSLNKEFDLIRRKLKVSKSNTASQLAAQAVASLIGQPTSAHEESIKQT